MYSNWTMPPLPPSQVALLIFACVGKIMQDVKKASAVIMFLQVRLLEMKKNDKKAKIKYIYDKQYVELRTTPNTAKCF